MKVKFLLMVGVCLFLVGTIFGQTFIKVSEAETKAFSTANGLQINLAIESNFNKNRTAKISFEILDESDRIVAQSYSMEKISEGKSVLEIPFRVPESDAKKLLWQRLRYAVALDGKLSEGIVSLSEIMPEIFGLRVESSEQIFAGMTYQTRVRAIHPTKDTPIADVEIDAELELELESENDEELTIKTHGKTDGAGYAILEFQIPPNVKFEDDDSADIKIIGTKSGLKSEAFEYLNTGENQPFVYFMTDKPLYQPAQKIYVRGLAMRKNRADEGMTVAAGRDFEFSIKDEEDKTLFRQKVKTSRFGVATIEWQIPDNAKLGSYRIEATDEENDERGRAVFKVSRYDLPNFIVQTKSDKEFYLPEQTEAEVTIDALYLFGKPVAGGKVKVVQEGKREWDYYQQKWDIKEESVFEGETDADGKYLAKIDVHKAHERLSQNEKQFEDLNFAAYFTDSTTNKTEQRRFDLRVTRSPVHVYLTKGKGGENNPNLPLALYVSTFSADGKPMVCDVEIKGKYEDEKEEKTVAKIKTNSLGAGKIEFFAPKRADENYKNLEFKAVARNAENLTGTEEFGYAISRNERQILVRTDKTIYRQGEPLKIEILSSETEETVFVDVLSSASTLESRRVKLKNGRAELKIPYNSAFKNYLIISAFFASGGETVQDANRVVYPQKQNLQVSAETSKEIYRPAEEAQMNFAVSTSDNKQTEAALGVVILDKAVEERARTDADFGGVNIYQNLAGLSGGWNEIDTKNLTAEQQLAAEMQFANTNFERNIFGDNYERNLGYVFGNKIRNQLYFIQNALYQSQNQTYEHPTDEDSVRKMLSAQNINFDALRDPWGNAYQAKFTVNRNYDIIEIVSAGANKTFGDADDFSGLQVYFQYYFKEGAKINEAVQDYLRQTGKVVRDRETLQAALAAKDINLDNLKDRWGEPYRVSFSAYSRYISIYFQSGGSDKKFDGNTGDDFTMWTTYADYYAETERKITQILSKFIADKKTFPRDEAEFKQILRDGGVDFDSLRDGWNRPFYLKFETKTRDADKIIVENIAKQGEKPKEILTVKSFAQQIGTVEIRSAGVDGVKSENNYQDVWFGTFGGLISEQIKDDGKAKLSAPKEIFVSGKSAIYGVVTDANKAVVPNATVKITNLQTFAVIETKTNDEGLFLQTNLAAGRYSIKIEMPGFKTSLADEIRLDIGKITETNFTLEVGAGAQTVAVNGTRTTIDLGDTKIDNNINRDIIENLPNGTTFSSLLKISPNVRPEALSGGFQIDGASGAENGFIIDGQEVTNFRNGTLGQKFDYVAEYGGATGGTVNVQRKETPRLREYFPETLLWIPELVTDAGGKVSIKFRLADNITTWKIYAIASDTQGRVGVTSKEIKAFQPFFVDLDPPKFLTEGDEIYLPTQVRNYTPDKQKVNVEMAQGDWFSFLGAGTQTVEVEPNKTQNAVFGFKAITPITDGKQRVTAIGETDSDAIEKPVTVRPNGQEIVRTESKLFTASTAFDINFPENALPKTPKSEVKIYPNLMAHVTESVEGLLQRPYGCGEQTTSSTYPNLMILKVADEKKVPSAIRQQAKKYLQAGYERLLGYQVADGGFSYWGGKDSSNVALTAYILRFLSEAKEFIEVDENVIKRTQSYLTAQQKSDGSFSQYYYGETAENLNRTKMFTAYIVRTLAADKNADKPAVQKALSYLKTRQTDAEEPYVLALFGLASLDAGNAEDARIAAEKLQKSAITEGDAVYWNLNTATPFYGWGMTGKLETTAVVLQFLLKNKTQNENLIAKATIYLLRNKDRYGVWYSTQTTINVLKAFLASLSEGKSQTVAISLNGEKLKDFTVLADQIEPIILDLSDKLTSANRLEITSSASSTLMAQVVSTHYIDWREADLSNQNHLRLRYECDKQTAAIMDEINCTVEAGRIGFQSWGMLLAEIGLPPGADVSRESLENAMKNDWTLSRYEVLPDRIVVYLWSWSGGTRFNFKFKPRYGINAQTPASVVYDYYNPEAQAIAAPLRFDVK